MEVDKVVTVTDLYNKLSKLGFSKKFIRAIGLPSWWTDEFDQSVDMGIIYEAAMYISKRLCIDLGSLIKMTKTPRFINNLTYEEVIELLKVDKEFFIVNSSSLSDEEENCLSSDQIDYYEQLSVLDI